MANFDHETKSHGEPRNFDACQHTVDSARLILKCEESGISELSTALELVNAALELRRSNEQPCPFATAAKLGVLERMAIVHDHNLQYDEANAVRSQARRLRTSLRKAAEAVA